MATPQEIAAALERSGPALLQGDRKALQAFEMRLADTDFRGLSIIAPAQVAIDQVRELPVVVAAQKTVLRGWEVMEEDHLALAVIDVDSGALTIGRMLVDPKSDEHPGGAPTRAPRPDDQAGQTVATKLYRLNARDRVEVPWRSGSVVVRALAFDWISNPARVELQGAAPKSPPRPAPIAPQPGAAGELPHFDSSARHPKSPNRGVDFRIDAESDGPVVILGAFTKAAAAAELLPGPQVLRQGAGQKSVVAVVRITLALVGLDQRVPTIARWGIPVFGAQPALAGQPISGHFAVDLRTVARALVPGSYAGWIFVGSDVYGPRTFQIR